MKATIIHTTARPPWLVRYRHATRGLAIRISPHRMLALIGVRTPPPPDHSPIAAWDPASPSTLPSTWCRYCRTPWPCQGHTAAIEARAARRIASAWASAAAGHITAITIAIQVLGYHVIQDSLLPIVLLWAFTTAVIATTITLCITNTRAYRRMARIHEGITRD